MADIAQTIQQGTAQMNQQPVQLQSQLSNIQEGRRADEYLKLQQDAAQRNMQQVADQIADVSALVVDQSNKKVSQARKTMEETQAAYDSIDFESPNAQVDQKQLATIQEAAAKAAAAYQVAIDNRNALIESIASNKGVMIAMDKSTYSNKDLGEKIFNKEVFDSMPETQRERVVQQFAAFAAAKQQMMQQDTKLSPFETRYQQNLADSMFGKGEPKDANSRISVLSQQQWETNIDPYYKGIGPKTKERLYNTDLAPYYSEYDKLQALDSDNQEFLQKLFKEWNPASGEEKDQKQAVDDFSKVLAKYEQAGGTDPMVRDVLSSLRNIVQSEEYPALRTGAFIHQMGKLFTPYQPAKLRPRSTGETGGM